MVAFLRVEKVDSKGVDEFLNLSRVEYDDSNAVTHRKHVEWKHLNTPYGPSTAINLIDNNVVIGRVMLQPRRVYIQNEQVPMAFATDSLVHPDFRRPLSNFFSIIKEIKKQKDFAFVIHTSNENTESIYHSILKLKSPISLSSYGLPVNLKNIAKKFTGINTTLYQVFNIPFRFLLSMFYHAINILTNLDVSDENPADRFLVEHISENSVSEKLEILREPEFIKWRYSESPLWKGDILYVYSRDIYVGYFVLRSVEIDGLKFTAVMDFSFADTISRLQMLYIRMYIVKKSIEYDDDAIYTLLNNKARVVKKFIGFPFYKISDKFLPHKTPFFVHVNNEKYRSMEECSDLHITLGDLDYF